LESVLPTSTEPLRKLTDLKLELSGVESLPLTVTVVLLRLSSGKYKIIIYIKDKIYIKYYNLIINRKNLPPRAIGAQVRVVSIKYINE